MSRVLVLLACLGCWAAPLRAQVIIPIPPTNNPITVCALGCAFANGSLQGALNTAQRGGTVLLEAGVTYTGPDQGFVLGGNCMSAPIWNCITVRTGVTNTVGGTVPGQIIPTSAFPNPAARMTTAYRATLAKLVPGVNNSPALRTIYPGETGTTCPAAPCRGDGWRVTLIEFGPKATTTESSLGPLVSFGTNRVGKSFDFGSCTYPDATPACWISEMPGGDTQDQLPEVPQYLSFEQNDVHGDPFIGYKNGILLATRDVRVLRNSFTDLKSRIENQAVISINGLGPFDVENNFNEATTENTMWGGSDSYLQLSAVVAASPSPSFTTIGLSTPLWLHPELTTTAASLLTDIYSNIFLTVTHAGTTYAGRTCTLSAITSVTATCTLDPALPITPSAGDAVRWNWVHGGVTLKQNWNFKPLWWMDAAVPKPSPPVLTIGPSTGTLIAGQHCYQVIQWAPVSAEPDAYSSPSLESCITITLGQSVQVTWAADFHSTHFWVYGNGAPAGETQYWNITAPTTTYEDTGAIAGTAGATGFEGQPWDVKNGLEMKGCDGAGPFGPCLIEGNVVMNNWCCNQNAAVTLKVHDQDLNDVSQIFRNARFQNNWISHGNRCLALITASTGNSSGPQASGRMTDVIVTNNLCTDLNTTYQYPHTGSNDNSAFLITGGEYPNMNKGGVRISLTHNSVFVNADNMRGPLWYNYKAGDTMVDHIVRDNIMGRDCSSGGCVGDGNASLKAYIDDINQGLGTPSWTAITSGSSFADHNEWPDGTNPPYTAGPFTAPFFVSDATLKTAAHVSNYSNCNTDVDILGCALVNTSSLHNTASDSTDVGANINTIKTLTDFAFTGGNIATAFTVEAEDYDAGGEGVAYHDTDTGNMYGSYRSDDVDVGASGSEGFQYVVANVFETEYLNYTRWVPGAATYTVAFRVGSGGLGGTFHLEVDGVGVTGPMVVPDTTGFDIFTTITKTGVSLSAGRHVLRLVMDTNGPGGSIGNFNWFTFTPQ